MILSYQRNQMEQQTCNQSTVKCNRQYKIVQWVVFLTQYVIAQKLLFCLLFQRKQNKSSKSHLALLQPLHTLVRPNLHVTTPTLLGGNKSLSSLPSLYRCVLQGAEATANGPSFYNEL